jgi:hypothetical protein
MGTLNVFKNVTDIAQRLYPETMALIVLVNTPPIFNTLYGLVKRFIDKGTLEKIIVTNSKNQKETLLKYVAPDSLPSVSFLLSNNPTHFFLY